MALIDNKSLVLLTDLYQLTMVNNYWKLGMHKKKSVFHLFFRKNPFQGQFSITCGLFDAIKYLNNLKFSSSDIQYLGSLNGNDSKPLFSHKFLQFLEAIDFECDIDAIQEGCVVFPNEPIIRVKGPLWQCQLLETTLLNIINFQTLIATKAARIVKAAEGDDVIEFGLRRAQGPDGGLSASRAAYIGGCHATSNLLAGKTYDIPVKGTHAHSWVMSFGSEIEAFEAYAKAMPNNCIFLVDTYDTIEGTRNAVKVGKALKQKGYRMAGIRLDSGDLSTLSKQARELLDEEGFHNAAIVASNDLDEYRIAKLKAEGAKITVWGVGTRLSTAYDQPALGGVYKLAAIENNKGELEYKIKLSEQLVKVSNPGIQQVRRYYSSDEEGNLIPEKDVIFCETLGIKQEMDEGIFEDLLIPVFKNGKLVYDLPDIHSIRNKTISQIHTFSAYSFEDDFKVELEPRLLEIKEKLRKQEKI